MESKNVKVIDEHGIDRNANIICSIDVDGSDYVVYWIERDNDNDNVFVSKVLKNNDGTSNMVNIEDSIEKGKISEIVKELITYSINNDADKISSSYVSLSSGKSVGVSSVIINREQNINVQKTYITTVKKSVTKVSSDFYNIPVVVIKEQVVAPSLESAPILNDKNVTPVEIPQVSPVLPTPEIIPHVEPIVSTPSVVVPTPVPVVEPVIEPVLPVAEKTIVPVIPVVEQVVTPVTSVSNTINEVSNVSSESVIIPASVVSEPTIEPVSPVISEVKVPEIVETPNVAESSKMIFDGSKETNLNIALGEVSSKDSPIAINNVESIREFGVDDTDNKVVQEVNKVTETSVNVTPVSQSGGFAHNKFFMFVAITFFVASCVFLGYEVFQYFQIK